MLKPFDVVECLGHFNGIIPSLAGILKNQHGVRIGKFLLNTPGNAISKTLNFKMSLDASTLKNLFLWCKFQIRLPFIISLRLKNFLTDLHSLFFCRDPTLSLLRRPIRSCYTTKKNF